MDSNISMLNAPTILMVEDDPVLRDEIARALREAGCDTVLAPTEEVALRLMAAAEFDGLYCGVGHFGSAEAWKVGAIFHLLWPKRPVVHAFGPHEASPPSLQNAVSLRKPFPIGALVDRLVGHRAAFGTTPRQPGNVPENEIERRIERRARAIAQVSSKPNRSIAR
ncbi:hypothetical protein AA309_30790 [Microvirga vignae]|uniref:Response regulatory domain-containing protein n=1 Tax=Microvirga vignae TaxID=1225564 RepID=A0A0H1R353_9HYPH|nr:response regulator [Microvirga vignae]KLK89548.1 hypothetical protein AA309_30790 [Microvirga vignae]